MLAQPWHDSSAQLALSKRYTLFACNMLSGPDTQTVVKDAT